MILPSISADSSIKHLSSMESLAADFFDPLSKLGQYRPQGNIDLPVDFQTLLSHSSHMTVTLEAFHESLVNVQVVAEKLTGETYSRHSLLTRQSDSRVVQSGIMRLNLSGLPEEVRQEIQAGDCPLGRILIRSGLLREVELLALWQFRPGPQLADQLELSSDHLVFGRSAQIMVGNKATVELLEIVKP